MAPQGCQIARSQATRLSCQQEIPGDAQGVGHDTIQFGGLGGVVVRQVAQHGRLGQGSCSDNVDGTVIFGGRLWHCKLEIEAHIQIQIIKAKNTATGMRRTGCSLVALDVNLKPGWHSVRCAILHVGAHSQVQDQSDAVCSELGQMPQTHNQASFWHFVNRNGAGVWGHLEYAACIHLSQHLSMRMPNYKTKQNGNVVSQKKRVPNCPKSPRKMTQGKHYNLFESYKLKCGICFLLKTGPENMWHCTESNMDLAYRKLAFNLRHDKNWKCSALHCVRKKCQEDSSCNCDVTCAKWQHFDLI